MKKGDSSLSPLTNIHMNNNNYLEKNQHFGQKSGDISRPINFVVRNESKKSLYLTNTDKVYSSPQNSPVIHSCSESDFSQKSMDLYNEIKDLVHHDKTQLRQLSAIGVQRCRLINKDTVVIYRNFNRLGNSTSGFQLAKENSNTDKARFASKQLAQERALANVETWSYFATLTFDKAKQNRDDFHALIKRVSVWLRRRHVKYFLVPELHKSGGIHFHALLSNDIKPYLSEFKDSFPKALKNPYIRDCLANGRQIRTCRGLADTFGYNIIEPIRDTDSVILYLTKYVLKTFDNENFQRISRRRFFISQGLKTPRIVNPATLDLKKFDLMAVSKNTIKIYLKRRSRKTIFNRLDSMSTKPLHRPIMPYVVPARPSYRFIDST